MEIIEGTHAKCSTIIVSQLPVVSWHAVIGDDPLSNVNLDRIVHTSHRIEFKGESLRKKSNIVRSFVGNPVKQKLGGQYRQKGGDMTRLSIHSTFFLFSILNGKFSSEKSNNSTNTTWKEFAHCNISSLK